jgi:hypothetical protein
MSAGLTLIGHDRDTVVTSDAFVLQVESIRYGGANEGASITRQPDNRSTRWPVKSRWPHVGITASPAREPQRRPDDAAPGMRRVKSVVESMRYTTCDG